LDWVNSLLSVDLTKIEQLGAGNVYCQILDAAYPEKVPLNKVKWNAFLEVDFLHNFKVLQITFERLGINKIIEVRLKLVRCRSWQKRNTRTILNLSNG
jgi:RP/EB family microtubule-associated protein